MVLIQKKKGYKKYKIQFVIKNTMNMVTKTVDTFYAKRNCHSEVKDFWRSQYGNNVQFIKFI